MHQGEKVPSWDCVSKNFVYKVTTNVTSISMDWYSITDLENDRLLDAIHHAEDASMKLHIFRTGLIPERLRKYQKAGNMAYDILSEREMQVFSCRLVGQTFPQIAEALEISVSSVKTYWRRAIAKCRCNLEEYM